MRNFAWCTQENSAIFDCTLESLGKQKALDGFRITCLSHHRYLRSWPPAPGAQSSLQGNFLILFSAMTKSFFGMSRSMLCFGYLFPDPVVCVLLSVRKITRLFSLVQRCLGHMDVSRSLFFCWWHELLGNVITIFTVWKVEQIWYQCKAQTFLHGEVEVPLHWNHTLKSHCTGDKTAGEPPIVVPTAVGRRMNDRWWQPLRRPTISAVSPRHQTQCCFQSLFWGALRGFYTFSQTSCTHNGKPGLFPSRRDFPGDGTFSKKPGHPGKSEAVVTLERSVCAPWGRSR